MIYAYKHYSEVFRKDVGSIALDSLGETLQGKSSLGNFLSQPGSLFSGAEIYDLKRELDFLQQFEISDKDFLRFLKSMQALHDHINFTLEFLDSRKNRDLLLFSLVREEDAFSVRAYELKQVAPTLFTEEDFENVLNELTKWKYEKAASLLLLSQGYMSQREILDTRDELEKVVTQKLLSAKTLQLCQFLLKTKQTKKEQFMVMEKYLSVYH